MFLLQEPTYEDIVIEVQLWSFLRKFSLEWILYPFLPDQTLIALVVNVFIVDSLLYPLVHLYTLAMLPFETGLTKEPIYL